MKSNVDLTRNRDFHSSRITVPKGSSFCSMFRWSFKTFQWIENGIKKEWINPDNPATRKDFDDFVKGITIVATGSRDIRKHKLNVRGLKRNEICEECNEPIRIPWKNCPCYEKWKRENGHLKQSCRQQLGYPQIIR